MLEPVPKLHAKTQARGLKRKALRPFIRWAGGKQRLVKEIFDSIGNVKYNRYFEPFLGGASVFLYGDFSSAVLSDLNPNLVNCYIQIRDNVEGVYDELMNFETPVEQSTYYKVRGEFNENNGDLTLKQAARFIFLNRTSFNGIYRVNRKGEYNVPFGKPNPAFSNLDHLKEISQKLKSAHVFNGYYDEILEMAGEGDLIYLDPPYPKLSETAYFNHYTLDKFDDSEQLKVSKFAEALDRKGCKVIISNADIKMTRELYAGWSISKCRVFRYVSCKKERKKVNELIIKNF